MLLVKKHFEQHPALAAADLHSSSVTTLQMANSRAACKCYCLQGCSQGWTVSLLCEAPGVA